MTQAKDISDERMLRAVVAPGGTGEFHWAMRWDVAGLFPELPRRSVEANYWVTEKGYQNLKEAKP